MPTLPLPRADQVTLRLIDQIVAQTPWINTQLAPWPGVTLSAAPDPHEPTHYERIRDGDIAVLPDGLTLCAIPLAATRNYVGAQNLYQESLQVLIRAYYLDPAPVRLSDVPQSHWLMLATLAQSLTAVLAPAALGAAAGGGWDLAGDGSQGVLLQPWCQVTRHQASFLYAREMRKFSVPYVELTFGGWTQRQEL